MIESTLKHEKLYSQLWQELKTLSAGDKFLSIREIMKRYSVSQLTVEKAVSRLREEEYLMNKSGKGLFASDLVEKINKVGTPTYLLVVPQWISVDIDTLEDAVQEEASNYPAKRLLVHKFNVSQRIPAQLPIQEENVEGIILLPCSGVLTLEDLQTIKSYDRPTVMLGNHLENIGFPCIGTDDTFAGNLAARHLIENGHKHIAVLLSEPHSPIIMNRVKAICDYAELQGIKADIIDCEIKSGEYATNKTYHKFTEVIKQGFSFTAIAGVSGESMQGAANACLNSGIRIPDDLSIIAIGAEDATATFHPPIDAVANNCGLQVKDAIELLDKLVRGEENADASFSIRPYIDARGSVLNLNSQPGDKHD